MRSVVGNMTARKAGGSNDAHSPGAPEPVPAAPDESLPF